MPGAVIVADQGAGAGPGSPGVARNDLWQARSVSLYLGVGGNTTYLWEMLSRPVGSTATLSTPTASTSGFTPDLVGTYRVRLTVNGGGPGNVQTRVYRCRYTNAGALAQRGWATPAYGETAAEANYAGNTVGYGEVFETVLADIRAALATVGMYTEVPLCASDEVTALSGYRRVSAVELDLSKYAATIGALTRRIRLKAVVSAAGNLDVGAVPWVCQVRLYNVTHGSAITNGAAQGGVVAVTVPATVWSSAMTAGVGAGHLRTDVAAVYELQMKVLGTGAPVPADEVYLHSAALVIDYV